MEKQFYQWAYTRIVKNADELAYVLQEAGMRNQHIMIGGSEHVINGVAQVIPFTTQGNITHVVILVNVEPLRPTVA